MIIDTFIFDKDFKALEIRLNELFNVVDYFVISESAFSHSGIAKPLYLSNNLSEYAKFQDKMIILIDKRKHLTKNPRIRQQIQRNKITRQLKKMKLNPTDLIIHSDCDEIPRANLIKSLSGQPIDAILQFNNYANYLNLKDGIWERCRISSYQFIRSVQGMRQDIFILQAYPQRRIKWPLLWIPDFFTTRRYHLNKFPKIVRKKQISVIPNGGWHFNNLFSQDSILTKISNSSHIEWNTELVRKFAVRNYLEGKDIYTGKKFNQVEIDQSYPEYIIQNLEKWKPFIFSEH